MKEEKYVYLTSGSEAEIGVYCGILKNEKIMFEIRDETPNAFFSTYGAQPPVFGKEIFVRNSDWKKARKVLEIPEESPISKHVFPFWVRVTVFVFLTAMVLTIILRIVALLIIS